MENGRREDFDAASLCCGGEPTAYRDGIAVTRRARRPSSVKLA